MAQRRMGIVIAVLLCFCVCLTTFAPCRVSAASTADAKEPINPEKSCSLTLSYTYDGTAFAESAVSLYQVAEVSADFQYTIAPAFAPTGLILNGIQTNGEWNVIRSTLESYAITRGMEPDFTSSTDSTGQVCFESLKPGLYLARLEQPAQAESSIVFDSALIALPGLGPDGLWQYSVAVAAKGEALPPVEPDEDVPYKVLKLWKGDDGRSTRPKSIEVELYRNGILTETVTLSPENNWSYTWSTKQDGAQWTVAERNAPAQYSMTLEQRGTTFLLTNTYRPNEPTPPGTPPQTGGSSHILFYVILLNVSGIALVLLGIAGKRRRV